MFYAGVGVLILAILCIIKQEIEYRTRRHKLEWIKWSILALSGFAIAAILIGGSFKP